MPVDKQAFHNAFHFCLKYPENLEYQEKASKYLINLGWLLANYLQIPTYLKQDVIADAIMRAWIKRNKACSDRGNYFNFFWTMIKNDLTKAEFREMRWYHRNIFIDSKEAIGLNNNNKIILGGDMNEETNQISESVSEPISEPTLTKVPSIKPAKARGTRKKYKTKPRERFSNGVSIAVSVWEGFAALKDKPQTEKELLTICNGRVKNPAKNYFNYIRSVARDRGYTFTLSDGQDENKIVTITKA